MKDLISVVTPVYGNKILVEKLYKAILVSMSKIDVDYEIIMVNDCCPYGSGEEIERLAKLDNKIKFIDLSRNFGQHIAIKAGIDNAKGDYIIVMDCDLQDNPEDIPRFYKKIKEGYYVVFGERIARQDNIVKKLHSWAFRLLYKQLSDFYIEKKVGTYSMITKEVASQLSLINTKNFEYGGALTYLGFKKAYIPIKKEERKIGTSGYSFYKGIKLALGSIIQNSNKPLVFAVYCSFAMFIFSFIFVLKLVYDKISHHTTLMGWTSLMVSIFFIAGLLFAYLALLGLYVGNIFQETKSRPVYTIKKKLNLKQIIKK